MVRQCRCNGQGDSRRALRRSERTLYHPGPRSWSTCRVRSPQGHTAPTVVSAIDIGRIGAGCAAYTVDGMRLGTVQGLYEGGPLHGHLLIHGLADLPRSIAIYLVPLWALRHHHRDGTAYLSVPVSYARQRWLIDIIDEDIPCPQP